MRKTKEIFFILLLTILFIFTISTVCYAENETKISEETLNLKLNDTRYLSIQYKPSGTTVVWTSNNENVATVGNDGKVTAVGIGTAIITATVGEQTFNCNVTVEYRNIRIKEKLGDEVGFIGNNKFNLFLEKFPAKQLVAIVEDGHFDEVPNAEVIWTSSAANVATVDGTGKVTAVSTGTATITATADTLSYSVEVTVYPAPQYTDFSNAKYELPFDYNVHLKISGIDIKSDSSYCYLITTSKEKPTIQVKSSGVPDDTNGLENLRKNDDENYLYSYFIDEYVELNSDMYLWVYEIVSLGEGYFDNNGDYVCYDYRSVVNGEKLTKPELPKLNDIIKGFSIGEWINSESNEEDNSTRISFRFPTDTENRKFRLKIGKVTDANILNKIHNNDYSGITALLTYAKNDNSPIYNNNLVTTSKALYRNTEETLLKGKELITDKAFYYIYAVFDDENGKYVPIEGVTLAQAWISTNGKSWDLWAYSDEKIEWANFSSTGTDTTGTDTTIANKPIPKAGSEMIIGIISAVAILGVTAKVFYKKNNY